ncbi:MAG: tetratricopeptide repeat protein [Bacteroidaceae bacterium]|nr:tetratricopeptide repeat protein [Bacteroidaceae bacterium]
MQNIKYILIVVALLITTNAVAQRNAREHIRKGNSLYTDSIYDKAEVEYLKALDKDSVGSIANYNLGNALLFQNKADEAIKQYQIAAGNETDKTKLAQIHHNMGVILQGAKEFDKAVEVYKQALRENPHDNMTRYNLALAMHQLKQQQHEQQQQQEQHQEDKEEQEQNQEQNQQQQQEQQEQQEQQRQQEQQENQNMSKENAEQLLESAMQDEKEVQEKVQKLMQVKGRKLDKDW